MILKYFKHETAIVEEGAKVGDGTKIWHFAHVRKGAKIGKNCTIGKDVYVDCDVIIGDNCKLENGVHIFRGAKLEDGVFIGPNVTFVNTRYPRSTGKWKDNWEEFVEKTLIKKNASIGGGCTILCGITIGENSIIGIGTVITRDIPANKIVYDKRDKVIKDLREDL